MNENDFISGEYHGYVQPIELKHGCDLRFGEWYEAHERWLDIGGGGPVMPAEPGTGLGEPESDFCGKIPQDVDS